MQAWLVKAASFYLACSSYSSSPYSSFLEEHDEAEPVAARALRCLRAMPGIGCPEYIAGLCWSDYQIFLETAGLLASIYHGEAPGTYAFGDSEQISACYRVCQVPSFYKKAKSAIESLEVFANITIADNEVGLLNGKMDFSALRMKMKLGSAKGSSKFWLTNTKIAVDDTELHFWMLLNC